MKPVLNNGPIRKPSPFISKLISGGGSIPTPPVPVLGTPVVISDTQINIPVTSTFPYEMWYSSDNVTYTKHGDGSTTPYEATGLTAGTLYYFKARGVNGSKLSEFSTAANAKTTLSAPTAFTSEFTVDTITGTLAWTDNVGGVATYEVYSNTNGAGDVLLATTVAGATSYGDTTCKQNASVVYKIRAKKGTVYSDYATATALVTPLCWKTNQTVRTNVIINQLTIAAGKTVNIDWGDGTNANYTGSNTNITKTYNASAVNIFNIKLSGDLNSITVLHHYNQVKSYGVITNWIIPPSLIELASFANGFTGSVTNWILPTNLITFRIESSALTGSVTNFVLPTTIRYFYIYSTNITGSLPQITPHETNGLIYQCQSASISDSVVTTFRKGMTIFNISNQNVVFSTANIDKVLKALADWYQVNAPTANCTFDMSGANMGIPTGGASNVDLVRLAGYYTAAGRTATIVVRTS